GRDPAAIERSVSPDVNMLASVDAFGAAIDAYEKAGFAHITLPWPRVETEAPVLRAAAERFLEPVGIEIGSYAPTPRDRGLRRISTADAEVAREIVARFAGSPAERCLRVLTDSPDTLIDGNAIATGAGVFSHVEVTRALAALGD